VWTNKHTNNEILPNIDLAPLCYAGGKQPIGACSSKTVASKSLLKRRDYGGKDF